MGMFDWLSPTAGASSADPSQSMGLMGMLANPQTAGLLGMAGGLLQAAGPSRLPVTNGMALGSGFQGMQQGIGNAIQNQRAMYTMQALQSAMGGQQPQSQPQGPMGAPVSGPANSGPMSGPSAGMGSYAGYGGAQGGSSDAGAPAQSGASIFGSSPQQLWQKGFALSLAGVPAGADMMKMAAQYDPSLQMQQPTDAMKMAAAAYGYGTPQYQQALTNQVANAGAMSVRPGGGIARGNQISMIPQAVPGFVAVQDPSNPSGWTQVPEGNGQNAISAAAAAKTAGEGSALPFTDAKDVNGNPLPIMSRTQAATGNLPLPLRNNNPGAVSPGGGPVAQYPDLQTGLQAMDQNLASYAGQQGTGTLGGVITKWVGSAPNAPAYIKDVTARLGIGAGTPVDLTNPAQRQAIATAIMLHESGPSAVFRPGASGSPAQGSGAIYAAPPMGAQTAVENTAKDNAGNYNNLSQFASASPDRVNTLDNMMALAQGTTKFGPGWDGRLDRMAQINSYLPSGMAFGSDAASNAQTFQKYASYLVQQYQRAMGGHQTDAQLNTVIHGTPNPEMLNQTMVEVIPKLKAMELAVQAKATAGDNWMAQHQNNAANYNQFESMWRQNYDPRIYQMQQMDLPTRAQFMKSQPDANALRAKVSTALQNGWVQ